MISPAAPKLGDNTVGKSICLSLKPKKSNGIPKPLSPTLSTSPPGIKRLTSIYRGTSSPFLSEIPEANGVLINVSGMKGKPNSLSCMFLRIKSLSASSLPISSLILPKSGSSLIASAKGILPLPTSFIP